MRAVRGGLSDAKTYEMWVCVVLKVSGSHLRSLRCRDEYVSVRLSDVYVRLLTSMFGDV